MKGPLVRLSMKDIVNGFGPCGHNLQDYINQLTDSTGESVVCYELKEEDGLLCVYYTTSDDEQAKWQRLIDLLGEADALQQELLAKHTQASYQYHSDLNQLADEFTDWANEKGYHIV